MSSFDNRLRAHRRDKAGRRRGRKRKRGTAGAEVPLRARPTTPEGQMAAPSLRVVSSSAGEAGSEPTPSSEEQVLAYSAPYSGSRFEVYQSRLTKADRAWQRQFTFTKDWHTRHVAYWSHHLKPFVNKPCNYLEIGCFEGLSTVWMLSYVLTNPLSQLTVCDILGCRVKTTWQKLRVPLKHGGDSM